MTQYVTNAFATQNGPIPLGQLDQNFNDATNFTASGSGAVNRFTITRLNDFLTDKDFGAAGTGGSDDTAAMQNAAASGKVVVCTGTSYRLSTNVSGLFLVASTVTYPGAGTLISTGFAGSAGMTNPMTTLNDIIIGGASGAPTRLGVGGTGQFLGINGANNLQWLNPPSGFSNPMTTLGDLIVGGASGVATRFGIGANGQVLGVASGAISWITAGTGTVTSVGLTLPGIFGVAGTPVTTSGTIAATFNTQTANNIFAGPLSGAAAVPTFRTIGGQDLQFPTTNKFFTQSGAVIDRLNDRVFLGGATACSGDFPQSTNDWFSAFYDANGYTGYSLTAMLCVETNTDPNAAQGGLFAAQSLHFASSGPVAIGVSSVAIGNGTYASNAYGIYAEAHRITSATNAVYAAEVDTRNMVNAPTAPTPYIQGNVVGLQIASGAGVSATGQFNASAAIQIESNPMTFDVGINFGSTSITGATGTSGTGIAMALGYGHIIQWYNSTGNQIGSFYSAVTTVADATNLVFTNNGLQVSNYLGSALLYIAPTASAVNPITLTAAATGVAPSIAVTSGSDTNIDLALITKGTGLVWIGPYTAGAVSATGYIEVKDSTGTLRKVPCL